MTAPIMASPRQDGHEEIRVRKKSATRIAIDTTTTVRVVLCPTPSVPPRVVRPKWQPTMAMMNPKMGVLSRPEKRSLEQHGLERRLHEEARADVVLEGAYREGSQRAEDVGEDAEEGHDDHRGGDAREDELLRRVPAEGADGVDLLGDVHGADLGRHAAADAPPTMMAVRVGPSSRRKERTMTRGMYSMPPKRWRPKANWMVMTIPMKTRVTATMPSERTPSESIW